MKKYKICKIATVLTVLLVATSCKNSDDVGESQIDTSTPVLNDLDIWLRQEFVTPYNIEIQYKWDINETDVERYLHPPLESSVQPVAEALLRTWIEPHNALGGEDFIKKIAPKFFTLVGSFNYNPNSPTITLGLAEAGVKISLFNIDFLDFTDIESIKQPLKTVQHEYGHILNQTYPYDPVYGLVNPENYTAQWFNRTDAEARELGYITAYASSDESEDFVEMVSEILTHSKNDFDAIVDGITDEDAKENIRIKEALVVEYYQETFGIDLYELQALTEKAALELVN